jgi:PAS domain S-box-containing protein
MEIQKNIDPKIKKIAKHYQSIVENAPDGFVLLNRLGHFKFVSPSARRMFGFSSTEDISDHPNELTHPDDLAMVLKQLAKLIENPTYVPKIEYRFKHKDGDWRWIESTFSNLLANPFVESIIVNFRDVTERKIGEERLRESEEKYRSLVENSPDAIAIYTEKEIVFVNNESIRLMGANSASELIGRNVIDFVHPDYRQFVAERMKDALLNQKVLALAEEKFIRLDGTTRDVEVKAIPITYKGQPAVQVIIRDILEKKLAEVALTESEEKFRSIYENSSVGKSMTSFDGVLKANKAYCEMLGYSEEELNSINWKTITHKDDIQFDQEKVDLILSGEKEFDSWEKRYIHKDGHIVWVNITSTLLRNSSGKPLFFIAEFRDISKRKHAEIALRESEERFKILFEKAPDAMFLADPETRKIVEANEAACRLFKKEKNELVGILQHELHPHKITSKSKENFDNQYIQSKKTGITNPVENNIFTSEGIEIPVEIVGQSIKIGEKDLMLGTFRDISERKKVEEALQQKMEEMSRFHNLTVGRELTMIELKKEINGLLRKSGQQEKYRIVE